MDDYEDVSIEEIQDSDESYKFKYNCNCGNCLDCLGMNENDFA